MVNTPHLDPGKNLGRTNAYTAPIETPKIATMIKAQRAPNAAFLIKASSA